MNPLERLRHIASIEGEEPMAMAIEAAYVLTDLAHDRSMLVSALRRLLDRHPALGVMWTIAARIGGSIFPEDEAWDLVTALSETWEATSESRVVPCSLTFTLAGDVYFVDENGFSTYVPCDNQEVFSFLESGLVKRVVVESDLVAPTFFLVQQKFEEMLAEQDDGGSRYEVVISPSAYSLVSSAIRDSLCLRLSGRDSAPVQFALVEMKPRFTIFHDGSELSPNLLESLLPWQVPQEILRTGGPKLG